MRVHIEQWLTRAWEKHQGAGSGPNESQAQRNQNIYAARSGLHDALSKKDDVEELTENLRNAKKKDRLAPLFEQALRKEMDCD